MTYLTPHISRATRALTLVLNATKGSSCFDNGSATSNGAYEVDE